MSTPLPNNTVLDILYRWCGYWDDNVFYNMCTCLEHATVVLEKTDTRTALFRCAV